MLRVLGPLEVEGPDGPLPVGGPVPRRILCALLVRPGAVVPVDSLLDAAWGDDPPPSAERTLISHITRLREALARVGGAAPPKLEHRGGGYRLVVEPEAVDAVRFEQTLLEAKNLSPARPRRHFAGLWLPGARLPRSPICRTRHIRQRRRRA